MTPLARLAARLGRLHGVQVQALATVFGVSRAMITSVTGDFRPSALGLLGDDPTAKLRARLLAEIGLPDDSPVYELLEKSALIILEKKIRDAKANAIT